MFLQGFQNVNSSPDTHRFFFLFLHSHSHFRKSSVYYVFLRQSCGGSSSRVRLGDSRRQHTICLFCYIRPPSLPKGPNPCRSLLRPWIAALSCKKSLFFSYQSDSPVQNVPPSNTFSWNKLWSSLKGFGSSGCSGADFASEQNFLQSEGVSLLSHDL